MRERERENALTNERDFLKVRQYSCLKCDSTLVMAYDCFEVLENDILLIILLMTIFLDIIVFANLDKNC